jgi:hypothetical protein
MHSSLQFFLNGPQPDSHPSETLTILYETWAEAMQQGRADSAKARNEDVVIFYRETLSCREEELNDRLGGDLPHPFSLWSNLAHGKEKESLRVQPEVSDECAQPLGIDVRVARGCCDALMAQERLHVAQIGSTLVEEERGGRMPQGMSGNNRHPRALAGELEACVEGLVAKGRAVPARKDKRRSREVDSPSPQPHALDAF